MLILVMLTMFVYNNSFINNNIIQYCGIVNIKIESKRLTQ